MARSRDELERIASRLERLAEKTFERADRVASDDPGYAREIYSDAERIRQLAASALRIADDLS
jgi:hypothetical protein